ncbi:MAG: VanZ family protein [Propionicimonas sp.]|jgi:glycopeptide antibiotics resistance protein
MADDSQRPVARRSRALIVVAGAYVLLAAALLFWPTSVSRPIRGLLIALNRTYAEGDRLLEIAANVLLFIPAGWLAGTLLRRGRRWLVIVGGVLASTTVELTQAALLPDRVASPLDVLANSVGATLGMLIAVAVSWVRSRRDEAGPEVGPPR